MTLHSHISKVLTKGPRWGSKIHRERLIGNKNGLICPEGVPTLQRNGVLIDKELTKICPNQRRGFLTLRFLSIRTFCNQVAAFTSFTTLPTMEGITQASLCIAVRRRRCRSATCCRWGRCLRERWCAMWSTTWAIGGHSCRCRVTMPSYNVDSRTTRMTRQKKAMVHNFVYHWI